MTTRIGLPGGARIALTAAAVVADLSVFTGYEVMIFCDEQQINYSFAPDGTSTTLVTGAAAPTLTGLVAKPLGSGTKMAREITSTSRFLVAATAASTGTLVIEPVRRL
jgi:hypothetical protein